MFCPPFITGLPLYLKLPKGHLQENQKADEKAFCIIPVSSLCQHEDSDSGIGVQAH